MLLMSFSGSVQFTVAVTERGACPLVGTTLRVQDGGALVTVTVAVEKTAGGIPFSVQLPLAFTISGGCPLFGLTVNVQVTVMTFDCAGRAKMNATTDKARTRRKRMHSPYQGRLLVPM